MCRQNHGVAVDYFALGVIVFECMLGRVGSFKVRDLMSGKIGNRSRI